MGKRKLHTTSFWQCDWTGLPMRSAHCYWPSWSAAGKLIKKGSYCNWESVMAHAMHQLENKEISDVEYEKVIDHVHGLTDCPITPAPHYDELQHTKGRMSAEEFHRQCCRQEHPITAVKISPNGDVFELLVHPDGDNIRFDDYLHKPFAYLAPPSTFHSMRKKGRGDRDLSVWYYATKELPHNHTASNLFKMQLYGDVLLVQQTREQCFMPRERYVGFTKQQFDDQFSKKRKRVEAQCMTSAQYDEVKKKMQATLNTYEEKAAEFAAPCVPTRAPPTDGKMLAKKAKERLQTGLVPPPQLLREW
tara:strand:- start:45 stop:956 length:912 start_codon:yes stop_codon:yes gene_type:complete